MLGYHAFDRDAFAANRARHQKRARFDPVRNDVVLGAVQFRHAFDDQAPRAGAFDFRAHLVQKICQIDNFRFLRRAFDHGRAFGQHRRHHHIVGAENGRAEFAAQIDHGAGQLRRKDFYVAAFHAHGRAERFKTFQMQIDRPIADDATARHRDGRFFAAAEQRAEHANRRAHFAHDIVGRDRFDLLRGHGDRAAGAFHLRAEMRQNLQHVMRVAQIRHATDDARLACEQRRRQDRQRRVFRAADLDRAGERVAAVDEDLIHIGQRENAGYLNNPFSIRCRDNFFAREARKSASLCPMPISRASRPFGWRCSGACSINLRTNSSPRSPPKSAASGSCKTSRESDCRSCMET